MQTVNTAFPDEETFQNVYEVCLENVPMATETIKKSYEEMRRALDKYISATEESMFRYAYQCGYDAAMKTMQKGGAKLCKK